MVIIVLAILTQHDIRLAKHARGDNSDRTRTSSAVAAVIVVVVVVVVAVGPRRSRRQCKTQKCRTEQEKPLVL